MANPKIINPLLLFLVLFISIIIVGCSTKYVCPDGNIVFQPQDCDKKSVQKVEKKENAIMKPKPIEKPKPEQIEKPKEKKPEFEPDTAIVHSEQWKEFDKEFQDTNYKYKDHSAEIWAKLKKQLKNVDGYFYYDDTTKIGTYYVKGDMIKLELATRITPRGGQVDFIIINRKDKTAHGYCQFGTVCDKSSAPIAWELDYNRYNPMTPADRLLSLVEEPLLVGDKMCANDARCYIMKFRTAEDVGEAWVNDFNGLPYYIKYKGIEYKYKDLAIASLEDDDVNLPSYINEYR